MNALALMGLLAAAGTGFFVFGRRVGKHLAREDASQDGSPRESSEPASSGLEETKEWVARDLAFEERALALEERERGIQEKEAALGAQGGRLEEEARQLAERQRAFEAGERERRDALEALETSRARYEEALARAGQWTMNEARRELLHGVRLRLDRDIAAEESAARRDALERSEEDAKRLLSLALMRAGTEVGRDLALQEVMLPQDSVKGKIIGKDGASLRAFESLTGVKLLIDDAPRRIFLSTFDPEKREIARRALVRMVTEERFHADAIDECVEQARRFVNDEGENTARETLVEALLDERAEAPVELLRAMGRLRFQNVYGQNVLRHSIEVARLAGIMADEMGLDARAARRAGFFHDVGKAVSDALGAHPEAGARLAERFGESEAVVHAIEAHHEDPRPRTPLAAIVATANTLSESRPGARSRAAGDPLRRMFDMEKIAKNLPGVADAYAVHSGHEVRVIVSERETDDARAESLAEAIARRLRSEVEHSGKIKVIVVRETRAEAAAGRGA